MYAIFVEKIDKPLVCLNCPLKLLRDGSVKGGKKERKSDLVTVLSNLMMVRFRRGNCVFSANHYYRSQRFLILMNFFFLSCSLPYIIHDLSISLAQVLSETE